VSLANSGANNVNLTDANALVLGAINVGSGTLSITSGAGGMTQTGAITQAAGAGGVSLTAGAANNMTLANPGNDFVGPVRILTANNVTLVDANSFAFGNGGTSAISGNLSLTANGAVTQVNAVTVAGTTSIGAGANPITLTNAANNFTGSVSATNTGANAIQITDVNALQLGAINTANNLSVIASGAITQAAPLSVGGTTSLTAGRRTTSRSRMWRTCSRDRCASSAATT
jgi:hypothetical protein